DSGARTAACERWRIRRGRGNAPHRQAQRPRSARPARLQGDARYSRNFCSIDRDLSRVRAGGSMRRLALLVCLIACGKSGTGDNTADAPPLTGDKYEVTWGPVTVKPGQESTQCIWVHLSNTSEIKVHQLHNVLSSVSHHLIVYKDDKDTA